MSRVSTGTWRLQAAALVLAAVAPMLLAPGCSRGARPVAPGGASAPSQPGGASVPSQPGVAGRVEADRVAPAAENLPGSAGPVAGTSTEEPARAPAAVFPRAPAGATEEQGEPPAAAAAPASGETGGSAGMPREESRDSRAMPAPSAEDEAGRASEGAATPGPEAAGTPARNGAFKGSEARPDRVVVARLPEKLTFDQAGPYWARGREELVYRVEFLGITMGYARFVFNGKVLLGGREVYHLSVRAWTSNVLALIYPVNDTIDYYMDIETLQPLRQEYTSGNQKKDDVTTYDQETGKIVYRYKASGEIRKQVEAVPNVYDPVTLAYLFRSREPGGEEKGRNVYAGRKVWEISARLAGVEKIATDRGEVETVVIRPVIKRGGKVEDKGDLRMWMTRDERKVPVRIYAKFKKIRTWTLVGELMPERKGG